MPVALLPPQAFSQAAGAFLHPCAGRRVPGLRKHSQIPVCGDRGAAPQACTHQAMPGVCILQQPTGLWAQGLQQMRPCISIHRHSCYQLSLSMAVCVAVSPLSLTAGKPDSICLSIHSFSFSHQKPCCPDPACVLPSAASSRQSEERGVQKRAWLKRVHQTVPPCAPPNLSMR